MVYESHDLIFYFSIATLVTVFAIIIIAVRRAHFDEKRLLESKNQSLHRKYVSSLGDTRAILSQLPNMIIIFDTKTLSITFSNPEALNFFGSSDEKELEKYLRNEPGRSSYSSSLSELTHWIRDHENNDDHSRDVYFRNQNDDLFLFKCSVYNTLFEGNHTYLIDCHHKNQDLFEKNLIDFMNRALVNIHEEKSIETLLRHVESIVNLIFPNTNYILALYDKIKSNLLILGDSDFTKKFRSLAPEIPYEYGATTIGTAAYIKKRVISDDLSKDDHWMEYAELTESLGTTTAWSEPILDKQNNLLAVMTLFGSDFKSYNDQSLNHFASIIYLIGLTIERQHWRQDLEKSSIEDRFIRKISVYISNITADDYCEGLTHACEDIRSHYNLESINLWEFQPSTNSLIEIAGTTQDFEYWNSNSDQPRSSVPANTFESYFNSKKPFYLESSENMYSKIISKDSNKTLTVIPIYSETKDRSLLGFMSIEPVSGPIAGETMDYLEIICSALKSKISSRLLTLELYEKLADANEKSMTDTLTGLPNRLAYNKRIAEEIENFNRYESSFVLCVSDIDYFKKINDTYGHHNGDLVLKKIAELLRSNIRMGDFVSRFGGEEFVIILTSTTGEHAQIALEKLRNSVEESCFELEGTSLKVTLSLGGSEIRKGDTSEKIFARADSAVYEAKNDGRNCVRIH